jgi:hypothetical protein
MAVRTVMLGFAIHDCPLRNATSRPREHLDTAYLCQGFCAFIFGQPRGVLPAEALTSRAFRLRLEGPDRQKGSVLVVIRGTVIARLTHFLSPINEKICQEIEVLIGAV